MIKQFSATEKLRAVVREIEMRKSVYGRRVINGQMSPHHAAEQIAVMEAIADDYRELADKERPRLL